MPREEGRPLSLASSAFSPPPPAGPGHRRQWLPQGLKLSGRGLGLEPWPGPVSSMPPLPRSLPRLSPLKKPPNECKQITRPGHPFRAWSPQHLSSLLPHVTPTDCQLHTDQNHIRLLHGCAPGPMPAQPYYSTQQEFNKRTLHQGTGFVEQPLGRAEGVFVGERLGVGEATTSQVYRWGPRAGVWSPPLPLGGVWPWPVSMSSLLPAAWAPDP